MDKVIETFIKGNLSDLIIKEFPDIAGYKSPITVKMRLTFDIKNKEVKGTVVRLILDGKKELMSEIFEKETDPKAFERIIEKIKSKQPKRQKSWLTILKAMKRYEEICFPRDESTVKGITRHEHYEIGSLNAFLGSNMLPYRLKSINTRTYVLARFQIA